MYALRHLAARRGSTSTRLRATAPLVAGTLLLAACSATPPPAADPPPSDDWAYAGPPAHFVLSITPAAWDLPLPTTTGPQPTTTIDLPEPTRPKPTETIPREPTTVLPPDAPVDPPGTPEDEGDIVDPELPGRGPSMRVVLACNPDAGSHPDPRGACDELRKVKGDFERLEPDGPVACTDQWDPVTVEAIGYWGDRRVSYTEWFENPCWAAVLTLDVFRFATDDPAW